MILRHSPPSEALSHAESTKESEVCSDLLKATQKKKNLQQREETKPNLQISVDRDTNKNSAN